MSTNGTIRRRLSRLPGTAAWIVGPLLIAAGLLGWGSAAATAYLVVGLFLTPRTRRELKELFALWVT